MQKSFITATPDSGSGNGTVTCSASQNNTENSRSTSITVSGGGMTRTVSISQAAGTVTYQYTFGPLESFTYNEMEGWYTDLTLQCYSYKNKFINGSQVGDKIYLLPTIQDLSGIVTSIKVRTNPDSNDRYITDVVVPQNTGSSSRTIRFRATQPESGKVSEYSIVQKNTNFQILSRSGQYTRFLGIISYNYHLDDEFLKMAQWMNTAYRTPLSLYGWDSATGTLVLRSRAYIGDRVQLMISSDGVLANITLTTGINWVD